MKIITAIASLFLILSCQKTLSDNEIKEYVWKCGIPCGLGDIIVFNQNTVLRNDTIFLKNIPYGKIVKRTCDFDEGTKISVINLENSVIKDTCIFHAK
ncbi:hypothetical protein NJT12_08310 [Flavobacterium sp. AC]|uniref:Lipoprotein n=1 Tax=Flavobacterium azizsancarii TaxID=2961580 RepID=A0ABT4WAS9_9FLAO|nr:hypothetical protein [Flavobacterium azizsancarii]MDA6069620.1 hypothetical protein [Flavobacterium azizsancarii]